MSEFEEKDPKTKRDKKELSQEELEKEQQAIFDAINSQSSKTLRDKVAWILNHFTAARDSDITLSLKYWEQFQPELFNGKVIHRDNLFKLTKTTSLTRERARIQNVFKLFLASEKVRKQRGKLEEQQYATALATQPDFPVSLIYADESGKNDKFLIVGSLWILKGYESWRLQNRITEWKESRNIDFEFHFAEMTKHKLKHYKALIDLLHEESSLLGFKALSIQKEGITNIDKSFEDLFYHLIAKGIAHDNTSGRAPIPRTIQFWKDADSPGGDKLLLINLEERLQRLSQSPIYKDKLYIDLVKAQDSKKFIHIQLTDLFTGAVNRTLNFDNPTKNYKDEFAEYFLTKFNVETKQLRNDNTITLFSI